MADNPMVQAPQQGKDTAPVMPITPSAANQTSMRSGMVAAPDLPAAAANDPAWAARVALSQKLNPTTPAAGPQEPNLPLFSRALPANGAPTPTFAPASLAANLIHPLTALVTSHALKNMATAAAPPAAAAPGGIAAAPDSTTPAPTLEQARAQLAASPNWGGGHPGDLAIAAPHVHSEDAFVKAVTGMPWSRAMQLVGALHPPGAQEQAMRLALQSAPNAPAAMKMLHMWSAPQSYLYGGMADPFATPEPAPTE